MNLDARLVVRQGAFELDLPLQASAGSALAILGPNGAGKTTALQALTGTVPLDGGHIDLDGRVLDAPASRVWVPPEERRIGLVHQDLLLFPHLSALDNIGFGLRVGGASRAAARAAALTWLERFEIPEVASAKPRQLSGGQAQRVALARALAIEPDVLLLDEPLSALDAGTRQTTRRDLRRWLDAFEGIAIIVTHDPLDALTLADEVVIVEHGHATQSGALADVAARPRTRYVADLIGTNLLQGSAHDRIVDVDGATIHIADPIEGPVFLTVAPRAVTVHESEPLGSARNRWPATVAAIDLQGDRVRVHTQGAVPLVAEVTPESLAALRIRVGATVWLAVKATEVATYIR